MICTFRFSLIYGESANHDHLLGFPITYYMFRDVGAAPNAALAPTIPVSVYSMFELSFSVVGPAIITAELSGKTSEHVPMCIVAAMTWRGVVVPDCTGYHSGVRSYSFRHPSIADIIGCSLMCLQTE
jgi:ammonia channel protein AmtB